MQDAKETSDCIKRCCGSTALPALKVVLTVEGMSCGSDAASIEKTVTQKTGIVSVNVSLALNQVSIVYDGSASSAEELKELVYDVSVLVLI